MGWFALTSAFSAVILAEFVHVMVGTFFCDALCGLILTGVTEASCTGGPTLSCRRGTWIEQQDSSSLAVVDDRSVRRVDQVIYTYTNFYSAFLYRVAVIARIRRAAPDGLMRCLGAIWYAATQTRHQRS